MADYGAKGSTQGFNVKNVADQLLSFSSSFPTPGIVAQQTFSSSGNLSHGLGYYPMVLEWLTVTDVSPTRTTMQVSIDTNIGIDNVYVPIDYSGITKRVFVTNIDLEKNLLSSSTGSDETPGTDEDFYIKISREGKDVSSTDLRDLVVDTTTRAPMVHLLASGTMTTDPSLSTRWKVSIKTGLPYNSFVYCFSRASGDSFYRPAPRVSSPTFVPFYDIQGDEVSMYAWKADYPTAPRYSIVVLKNKEW